MLTAAAAAALVRSRLLTARAARSGAAGKPAEVTAALGMKITLESMHITT